MKTVLELLQKEFRNRRKGLIFSPDNKNICLWHIGEGAKYQIAFRTGVVADNKNLDDVKKVIQIAIDVYGDLDIVINNAAIGEQKMIDETDDEWLEHVYQINVFGPFRFIRESLKVFLPKNEGCIINISSVNGDRPFCGASYTSSKGAINTLTKNVAMRLIDTNIRINAVAPGATVTPAHLANKAGEQPGGAKMLEYSKHFVCFPGPECDPMDQANACLFLASDMGKHVKGQVIQVCNGAFLKRRGRCFAHKHGEEGMPGHS